MIDYELLSQPMRVPFIPSLDRILSVEGASVSLDPLGFVRSTSVLQTVSQYQMRSGLNPVDGVDLSKAERAAYLALPKRTNPLAQAHGAALAENHQAPDARIQAVLAWYFDDFTYTLNPGASEGDSIDHFLFETRRGFCEHFAASFTWIMRAAGIPARVVLGYQGGAYNHRGTTSKCVSSMPMPGLRCGCKGRAGAGWIQRRLLRPSELRRVWARRLRVWMV